MFPLNTLTELERFRSRNLAPKTVLRSRRLLLVKENFLHCSGIFHGSNKKLDKQDIKRIFKSYDRVSCHTAHEHAEAPLLRQRTGRHLNAPQTDTSERKAPENNYPPSVH